MKILLVWPNGYDITYTIPISLGYLKANLDQAYHQVTLLDCSLNNIDASSTEFKEKMMEIKPDIVGVSCWSPTYLEAVKVLEVAKSLNPSVITVMGGAHATSYPDKIMANPIIDYIIRGEADLSFRAFVEEAGKGNPDWSTVKGLVYRVENGLRKNAMERKDELDEIKIPDYDAMQLDRYIQEGYRFNTPHKQNAPVWITRGCPYRCSFCSAPQQNGKLIRSHSVAYMTNWVKYLYFEKGIRQINIIDDNFTYHMDYAKEFCREMIKLNLQDLHFGTPNGIRIQRTDKELLQLMKLAGWENLIVAPESGSVKTLARMRKDLDPAIIPEKVREIKEAGLKVHGFFIIGYPGEAPEDLQKTVDLLRKCKFNFFFLNNFQPLPGTPVYDELVKAGEIEDGLLPKNYSGGERVYVPEDLKDFNFSKFVLKEYVHLALADPYNIPYMFRLVSPKMIIKKVYSNVKSMLKGQVQAEKIAPHMMMMEE